MNHLIKRALNRIVTGYIIVFFNLIIATQIVEKERKGEAEEEDN